MSENESGMLIREIERSCEEADYFPKLFLLPMQVALGPDNTGLVRVVRPEGTPDKFTTELILPAEREPAIDEETMRKQNILSFFASREEELPAVKLAICVCAYSEDSTMLRRTLNGITDSYPEFEKAGISPHEIAVVFVFDGIAKLHESVQTLFTNMDAENRFLWKEYASTLQELRDSPALFDLEEINIYSKEELGRLSLSLLPAKKREYLRQTELLKTLAQMKGRKGLQHGDLPEEVKKEYLHFLALEHKALVGLDREDGDSHPAEYYVRYFETRPEIREKCVYLAIAETEQLCRRYLANRDSTALLYSYRLKTDSNRNSYVFMCVKHQNQGKLWSHNWFFNGFCRLFNAPYCILMDVGLRPEPRALFRMHNYMATHDEDCGGVCGYMSLSIEKPEEEDMDEYDVFTRAGSFFFDIQRAQQFEYHFSHMLDKPFESAFGFIHVLPGAFSGYNLRKILDRRNPILQQYFRSITDSGEAEKPEGPTAGMFRRAVLPECLHGNTGNYYAMLKEKNIYLAEDRILCLGIHEAGFKMAYLYDAEAHVDSVTTLDKLLGQRKRWINGSYFAFDKVIQSWNCSRSSCGFSLQMVFNVFVSYLGYFSLALFFNSLDLTFTTLTDHTLLPLFRDLFRVTNDQQLKEYPLLGVISAYGLATCPAAILVFLYIVMVGSMIVLSINLPQTNQRFKKTYYLITSLLGWYSILMYIVLIIEMVRQGSFLQITSSDSKFLTSNMLRILIISIIAFHAVPPLVFMVLKCSAKYAWEVMASSFSYLYYAPAYLHVLTIFAYCRIDDLSWGTKGLTALETHHLGEAWAAEKHVFVSRFVIANIIAAVVLKLLIANTGIRGWVIFVMTILLGIMLLFKLIVSLGYIFKYLCTPSSTPPNHDMSENSIDSNLQRPEANTIYKKYIPLLVENMKKQYKQQIDKINKNKDVSPALRSMIFTKPLKKVQLSRIERKEIPRKFSKKPLPSVREEEESLVRAPPAAGNTARNGMQPPQEILNNPRSDSTTNLMGESRAHLNNVRLSPLPNRPEMNGQGGEGLSIRDPRTEAPKYKKKFAKK